jgi:hypothetical protein
MYTSKIIKLKGANCHGLTSLGIIEWGRGNSNFDNSIPSLKLQSLFRSLDKKNNTENVTYRNVNFSK